MADFMFTVVPIVIALTFAFIIYSGIRNYSAAKQQGADPITLQTDLQVRALRSDVLRPERSMADRLAEVDDLHARGIISDDERATARSRILAD